MKIHVVRTELGTLFAFVAKVDAECEVIRMMCERSVETRLPWFPGEPTPGITIETVSLYGVGEGL